MIHSYVSPIVKKKSQMLIHNELAHKSHLIRLNRFFICRVKLICSNVCRTFTHIFISNIQHIHYQQTTSIPHQTWSHLLSS